LHDRSFLRRFLGVLLVAILGGVVGLASPAGGDKCAKIHQVEITFEDATGFKPQTIVVRVGDCVRWVNVHGIEHSAVAVDRSFHTGTLMPGSAGTIEFTKPGVYPYTCGPHPPMVGRVVVESVGAPDRSD
jgi:plastocyanin